MKIDLDRRDFLAKALQVSLIFGGVAILYSSLKGCKTAEFKEDGPIIYPPLKRHKMQPPDDGSYFGFHTERRMTGDRYRWIKERIRTRPKIWIPPYRMMSHPSAKKQWWEYGWRYATPFVFFNIHEQITGIKFENLFTEHNFSKFVRENAEDVVRFKRPIFLSMMPEPNGPWWPWGKKPKEFIEVWRHVWRVFEETGANKYATWVFHLALFDLNDKSEPPDAYYPGNEYIDWIGLVAYSIDRWSSGSMSLKQITQYSYSQLRKKFPRKPIMLAEVGKSTSPKQNQWIKEAYEYIRLTPGIKASIYWEWRHPKGWTNLTDESFETLKHILQDNYFIRA